MSQMWKLEYGADGGNAASLDVDEHGATLTVGVGEGWIAEEPSYTVALSPKSAVELAKALLAWAESA